MEKKVINFNTITVQELEKLPGIGKSKAQALVDHRNIYSHYKSITDLTYVEGITKALIKKLQDEYIFQFGNNISNKSIKVNTLKRPHRSELSQSILSTDDDSHTPDKKIKPRHVISDDVVSSPDMIDKSISSRVLPSCASPGHAVRSRLHSETAKPPNGLNSWLDKFHSWSRDERLIALNDLIGLCDMSVVRHMMAKIEPHFQRDFISLLPKELALYVLSFLDPKDLCNAAKTCRYWRILGEDNL